MNFGQVPDLLRRDTESYHAVDAAMLKLYHEGRVQSLKEQDEPARRLKRK